MSNEKRLWVLSRWAGGVPSYDTAPKVPEGNVIVADTHMVLVEATWDEANRWVDGYSYWRVEGQPKAGKWIDSGGGAEYINDYCEVVSGPIEVLKTLELHEIQEDMADEIKNAIAENDEEEADALLLDLGLVF